MRSPRSSASSRVAAVLRVSDGWNSSLLPRGTGTSRRCAATMKLHRSAPSSPGAHTREWQGRVRDAPIIYHDQAEGTRGGAGRIMVSTKRPLLIMPLGSCPGAHRGLRGRCPLVHRHTEPVGRGALARRLASSSLGSGSRPAPVLATRATQSRYSDREIDRPPQS